MVTSLVFVITSETFQILITALFRYYFIKSFIYQKLILNSYSALSVGVGVVVVVVVGVVLCSCDQI